MIKYRIEIEETISQLFEVSAQSAEEALKIAEQNYKNEDFVLAPGNLTGIKFNVMSDD